MTINSLIPATSIDVEGVFSQGLVFGSPVQSGLLTSRAFNRNRNRSIYFRISEKTGPNRCGPVHIGFFAVNRPV